MLMYDSLFDQITNVYGVEAFEPNSGLHEKTTYKGNLENVINELSNALIAPDTDNILTRILHPPRIIRSALDRKIEDPSALNHAIVRCATEVGQWIYAQDSTSLQKLYDLSNLIRNRAPDMLQSDVVQKPYDSRTWKSMDPRFSHKSAEMMTEEFKGRDVLFIALAHGAIPAGLDVFLRYVDQSDESNSYFMPVRFSRIKMNDKYPQVSEAEREFINQDWSGKDVLVFDDDISSGTTFEIAYPFFKEVIPNARKLFVQPNYDPRY